MQRILLIGATSAIAQSLARRFAARGDRLFLLVREQEKLNIISADLRVRGADKVDGEAADLTHTEKHAYLLQQAEKSLGHIDVALIAYGTLGDQSACEADFSRAAAELQTNFLSAVSLLTLLGNYFATRRGGQLAVLSSVAGDRGRQSNYVYGAAKGGLSVFLQGLRNRLYPLGVQVLTVKPGFVDTPMTADYPKNPLFVSPDKIATDILKALDKRRHELYTPWFWRWIMLLIRLIPESLFVRLKL